MEIVVGRTPGQDEEREMVVERQPESDTEYSLLLFIKSHGSDAGWAIRVRAEDVLEAIEREMRE